MNRADFQELAEVRIAEAMALLENGQFDGAYYLAGYAAECALKACIAKQTQQYDFPDRRLVNASYTHNLAELLGLAGVADESWDEVSVNWAIVKEWSEESRYRRWSRQEAESLISSLTIEPSGVLPWLRLRW